MASIVKLSTLKNAADTTAMTISTAGLATYPARPAFQAVFSRAGGNFTPTANNGEIIFNASAYNIGGCFNTSTGRFTAPIAGMYSFMMFGVEAATNNSAWYRIRKNGTDLPYPTNGYSTSQTTGYAGSAIYSVMSLQPGDYVSVFVIGGGLYSDAGVQLNGFSGYLAG